MRCDFSAECRFSVPQLMKLSVNTHKAGTVSNFTPRTSETKSLGLRVTASCKSKLLNFLSQLSVDSPKLIPTLEADMNSLPPCLIIHLYVQVFILYIDPCHQKDRKRINPTAHRTMITSFVWISYNELVSSVGYSRISWNAQELGNTQELSLY